ERRRFSRGSAGERYAVPLRAGRAFPPPPIRPDKYVGPRSIRPVLVIRQRIVMRQLAVIASLLVIAQYNSACESRQSAEARRRIQPVYDRETGKLTLLKYDSNGDGKPDI